MSASTPSEAARALAGRRWSTDPQGLDRRIAELERRALAFTSDHVERLRALVAAADSQPEPRP